MDEQAGDKRHILEFNGDEVDKFLQKNLQDKFFKEGLYGKTYSIL